MSNPLSPLSVAEIFASGRYVIPVYQRNYAWAEPEITQLIQDVYDYAFSGKGASHYYIGTLIVFERQEGNEVVYETIDGQQRLTTLHIVLCALHRLYGKTVEAIPFKPNLSFDSRIKSTETLQVIAHSPTELQYLPSKAYNVEIQQAYEDTEKALKRMLTSDEQRRQFYEYLTQKVQILRVAVPADTNLNHYFEIMNSRGEQLEKHEILKAKMLEILSGDESSSEAFTLIWEGCSDMERYVQYGFTVDQRNAIFSERNWNQLTCEKFEDVADKIAALRGTKANLAAQPDRSLSTIVNSKEKFEGNIEHNEEAPDRFSSVISFPNFLLHVLRIQTQSDISLDDKQLITLFDAELEQYKGDDAGKVEFVKSFVFNLLKCKWLFDNFILKREFIRDADRWSLKRLKWYDGNRVSYVNRFGGEEETDGLNKEILMLLAMFHVSAPTMVYKHWLNAALNFAFHHPQLTAEEYRDYLKELARAYLFDRYVAKTQSQDDLPLDYFQIIYLNGSKSVRKGDETKIDWGMLHRGTDVENFVFNLVDFILWEQRFRGHDKFEFGFRSSVEHYYPQNPIAKDEKIDQDICDNFGNLCLISSSKNSRLSNHLPEAKKDYYIKVNPDSLKQQLMMQQPKWGIDEILDHGIDMIERLKKF